MKRFALTTAILLGLTAPALASDQLARSLGVEPGTYSTAELIGLRTALEESDAQRANAILSGTGDAVVSRSAPGHIALANQLGVNPAQYSFNDLIALRAAEENDEKAQAAFIRGNVSGGDVVSSRGSSAGSAQLAAALGVDADRFTTVQLIQLRDAMEDDDRARVNFILSMAR